MATTRSGRSVDATGDTTDASASDPLEFDDDTHTSSG
jgi:hypothetical protein